MKEKNYLESGSGRKGLESSRFKRGLFIVAGTIFLWLGGIGIFLPILPTTPFLLLSAACYYKGSERLHRWMLNNRWFGSYIRNYREGKGVPLIVKVFTIFLLWITILFSVFFILLISWIKIILIIIAIGVTIHILTIKTYIQKRQR